MQIDVPVDVEDDNSETGTESTSPEKGFKGNLEKNNISIPH